MTRLGLTNADLVNASTEQLSFKMVQKGRRGRRLTPNMQSKILTALLAVKPDLNLGRRDLFRDEMSEAYQEEAPSSVPDIESIVPKIEEKKVGKRPKKKAVRYRRRSLTRKARVDASTRFFKTGR